jgi:hypothetical protein
MVVRPVGCFGSSLRCRVLAVFGRSRSTHASKRHIERVKAAHVQVDTSCLAFSLACELDFQGDPARLHHSTAELARAAAEGRTSPDAIRAPRRHGAYSHRLVRKLLQFRIVVHVAEPFTSQSRGVAATAFRSAITLNVNGALSDGSVALFSRGMRLTALTPAGIAPRHPYEVAADAASVNLPRGIR